MRSFAVIAGFAAAANALVATDAGYYASSSEAAYYASSSEAAYYASSTEAAYYASSTEAAYYASSSSAAKYDSYSSSAPAYDSYSTKVPTYETPIGYSTTVISKYETDCPEPTTITWNKKTYTVTKSTKLTITEPCTTTVPVYASTSSGAVYKPSSAPAGSASKSAGSSSKPAVPAWSSKASSGSYGASSVPAVPYYPVPSNGTSYTPPKATGTGAVASSTKSSLPESTGAAAQMGVGMLAVIGAVAAFL